MSKFGKYFRLACAIINIILGMAYMMYSLDHKKPIEVVIYAAIIAVNYWWITNFMGNKEKVPEGALERYAGNTVIVKQLLEDIAEQANAEGKAAEINDLAFFSDIVDMLKPEIEQKYNVTMIPCTKGYIIRPNTNTNYLNEYWS